jgi:uncharacterized protein
MSGQPTTDAAESRAPESIDVSYSGTAVFVSVPSPAADGESPTLDQAVHALASSALVNFDREALSRAVRNPGGPPAVVGEVAPPKGLEENWFVTISSNRMAAFVVPVPTKVTDDPDAPVVMPSVSGSAIRKQLTEQGVEHGVMNEALETFSSRAELSDIVQVAQGTPAVEGRDARIERVEAVLLAGENHEPVKLDDGSVDHHATMAQQFVEEGTVIATRKGPIEGTDGLDILGNPRPARAVKDQLLDSYAGQNTEVRGDQLVTTGPGRPMERGNRIDVLPVYEVEGDLDYSVGNIEFAGDVTVRGDVRPGFSIHATGSVTVHGFTEHATIHADGDVVLQGVVGLLEADDQGEDVSHEPEIVAGGDLTATYLHNIAVEVAGAALISREVVDCQLVTDSVKIPSKGRIVGGLTRGKLEIECGTLGSPHGVSTHVQLQARRSEGPAVLRVLEAVKPGVKINVMGAVLDVEDELPSASFWQLEGDVVRLDGMATVNDLIALAEATDRRPPQLPGEADDEAREGEAA